MQYYTAYVDKLLKFKYSNVIINNTFSYKEMNVWFANF